MNDLQHTQAKTTEVAIVEAQWSIAKMAPRDENAARTRILSACDRVLFAEGSHYLYKRQNTDVKGPTIRAAEHMARNWGNIDFGYRVIQEDSDATIGEAYCIDLQTNVKQARRFMVPHMRHTKRGSYAVTDPRDISEMVSNRGMRQVRNCILSMIPTDIIEEFNIACDKTILKSIGNIAEARAKLVKAFEEFGVSESALARFAKKNISEINAYDILKLRRIYTSIKDGMTKVHEWFDVAVQAESVSPMEEIIQSKKKAESEKSLTDQAATKRATESPESAAQEQEEPLKTDQETKKDEEKPKRTRKMNANANGVLMATIGRIAGAFERADITRLDIARRLGKPLDMITPEEVEDLRADMKLIKAGSATALDLGYVVAEVEQADSSVGDEAQTEDKTESEKEPLDIGSEILKRIEEAKPGTTDLDDIEELLQEKEDDLDPDVADSLYGKLVDKYREQSAPEPETTS